MTKHNGHYVRIVTPMDTAYAEIEIDGKRLERVQKLTLDMEAGKVTTVTVTFAPERTDVEAHALVKEHEPLNLDDIEPAPLVDVESI